MGERVIKRKRRHEPSADASRARALRLVTKRKSRRSHDRILRLRASERKEGKSSHSKTASERVGERADPLRDWGVVLKISPSAS